jgi:hypothetical protein
MSSARTTTDHDTIRKWIEDRGGRPAMVRSTADGGRTGGLLRVDFREPDDELEEIGWDEFFRIFDDNRLAFLHQDQADDGGKSRFNKFVERENA